jgi:hypothetical protein
VKLLLHLHLHLHLHQIIIAYPEVMAGIDPRLSIRDF